MAGVSKAVPEFEDMLPVMAEKLGGEGLMKELCNGFELLMDKEKGVITVESLKRNAVVLGLQDLRHDELVSMVEEGDTDGDGALNEMEFCVLMFRLSPGLMKESKLLLEEILQEEIKPAVFGRDCPESNVRKTAAKIEATSPPMMTPPPDRTYPINSAT